MTFWVRFLEISGNFHHELDVYTTSFHHVFTTFHYIYTTFTPRIYTTRNFHDIFSLRFHYKCSPRRDKQTGTNRLHGDAQTDFHYIFTPQIYTTHFHHRFSPQIFTTKFTLQIFTMTFTPRIFTTNFHYEFSLRIFTTTFTLQIYTTVIVVIKIKFIIHT